MSHIVFGSIYQLCDTPALAVTVYSKSFGSLWALCLYLLFLNWHGCFNLERPWIQFPWRKAFIIFCLQQLYFVLRSKCWQIQCTSRMSISLQVAHIVKYIAARHTGLTATFRNQTWAVIIQVLCGDTLHHFSHFILSTSTYEGSYGEHFKCFSDGECTFREVNFQTELKKNSKARLFS